MNHIYSEKKIRVMLILAVLTFVFAGGRYKIWADDDLYTYTSGDFSYQVWDGETAGIVSCSSEDSGVIIPDSLDGYTVTAIAANAFTSLTLKDLTIPETVTNILPGAFSDCANLARIDIVEGNDVYEIYDGMLISKKDNVLLWCSPDVESCVVPSGIKSIADYAFRRCYYLTDAALPEGLESIGDRAFFCCYDLQNITLPEGLKSIGEHAFSRCSELESIAIPSTVTHIGFRAFYNCTNVQTITVAEGNSVFELWQGILLNREDREVMLYSHSLENTDLAVPEGTESIADAAFAECYDLTDISLPEGLKNIGANAFYSCNSLENVYVTAGVESIGDYAFAHCTALENIYIPESVETIGEGAFEDVDGTILVDPGSYAEQYCQEYGLYYTYYGQ